LAGDIRDGIESAVQLHNFHDTVLKSIELNVNNLPVIFRNSEFEKFQSNQLLDSIVCACDKLLISRDAYRQLAATMPDMVREYKIENRRHEITNIMDNKIPIHMVQVNSETSNGAYRSLKDILFILIPKLAYGKSSVLQLGDVIYIKLSGDKRQVGKYHNHIMLTACILNEHDMVLNLSNQHCIFLYNGTEQYESLQIVFSFLISELTTLNTEGIIDSNNNHWKIEFWFGSDWKFMSLILGTKGPTANYFCLYCDCKSMDRWDMNKDYENLCNTQGRKNLNLLPFLEQQHSVPDELHVMLRITDVLFECLFFELSIKSTFNKKQKNNEITI